MGVEILAASVTGEQHADTVRRYRFDQRATLDQVMEERERQDEKWGGTPGVDRTDDHTYAAVLGEEFGEVCKAWLERDVAGLRTELVQTAAVALAWIEELDNGGMRERP
jgi:hypothetical protein